MSLTGKVSFTSVGPQVVSALSLGKEKKLVCTISVVLNISLYCISQMWGYDRWGEKEICETENEEKCHPVSTNDSALG